MKLRVCFAAGIAAAWVGCVHAQAGSSLEQDAAAFGTRETTTRMDLSPDGKLAVFLGAGPGRTTIVYIADIAAGTVKPIVYSKADPETLRWCYFASNSRIACRFTAIVKSEQARLATSNGLIAASRTVSVGIDGMNMKPLGQPSSAYDVGLRQFDGNIIDWRPGGDNQVLMTRLFLPEGFRDTPSNVQRTKHGVGVVRLNVDTLKAEIVEQPRDNVAEWMSDGQGHVRLLGTAELSAEAYSTGRMKWAYRTANSRDWKTLTNYVETDAASGSPAFIPLAIDASVNSLYALRKRNGRMALTKTELTDTPVETVVAENPKVDIDDVVRSADGKRVIGYTYLDDHRQVFYFDPEYKNLSAALTQSLPNHPLVHFSGASDDGSKLLLFAGSDRDPGRYFLFDKLKKSVGEVMAVRPNLAARPLAEVKPITYAAADGTQIPAYLTLPPGRDPKNLPAVVLPHGGPTSRDEWGFDWISQFLAARGYAVIQPQYRGSAGYGDSWLAQNGFKGWRTSIGDISDAARYLARQRIADPERIAIVGWSYGGYAALQSAAVEPSLYKAVVAIAPVTDLSLLKSEDDDSVSRNQSAAFIGSGATVTEGSPVRRAAAIRAPVLLVHGDRDLNVGFAHSQKMQAALLNAGRQSEFLSFAGLDHQLADNEARAQMLVKIGQLLDRTIGH